MTIDALCGGNELGSSGLDVEWSGQAGGSQDCGQILPYTVPLGIDRENITR